MGLTATMLAVNGAGRLRCSTSVGPAQSTGGTPTTSTGLLSLALSAPTNYTSGLGYVASGAVAADIGGAAARYANGLPFTSADRLACHQTDAIVVYKAGLPFSAAGALCTAAPE